MCVPFLGGNLYIPAVFFYFLGFEQDQRSHIGWDRACILTKSG